MWLKLNPWQNANETVCVSVAKHTDGTTDCEHVGNNDLPQLPWAHEGMSGWQKTRENACNQETLMKIRAVTMFAMAHAASTREHARNMRALRLPNMSQTLSTEAQAKTSGANTHRKEVVTPAKVEDHQHLQMMTRQRKTANLTNAKGWQIMFSPAASQKTTKRHMNISWVTWGKIMTTVMTWHQLWKKVRHFVTQKQCH